MQWIEVQLLSALVSQSQIESKPGHDVLFNETSPPIVATVPLFRSLVAQGCLIRKLIIYA